MKALITKRFVWTSSYTKYSFHAMSSIPYLLTKPYLRQNGKGKEELHRCEKREILYFLETKQNMGYWGQGRRDSESCCGGVVAPVYRVISA